MWRPVLTLPRPVNEYDEKSACDALHIQWKHPCFTLHSMSNIFFADSGPQAYRLQTQDAPDGGLETRRIEVEQLRAETAGIIGELAL